MTTQHNNIIDDALDLGLVALSVGYLFLSDAFGFALSDETLIQIAAVGGAGRAALRRVLAKFVERTLAREARASEPGVVERVIDPDLTPVDGDAPRAAGEPPTA